MMQARSKIEMHELSHEAAYEMAEHLEQKITCHNNDTIVHHGRDAKFGVVYIVIPALGNPLVLPIVFQDAEQ